ncbi:MAG TPA: hypothetical protein VHA52_05135 [Candidatus Babeliaceae bacterium]|nr:hypothetical protein [Candidatus Babeliaceae bacterium]
MNEIIIYQTIDLQIEIEVRFDGDTVWLTQQQMASLFNQTKQNVSQHVNNCVREGKLSGKSVVKDSLTTALMVKIEEKVLQPGCGNFDWLQGIIQTRYSIPSMGNPKAKGLPGKRLCYQSKKIRALTIDHPTEQPKPRY